MNDLVRIACIVPSLANKGPIRVVQTLVNTSVRLRLPLAFTVFYLEPSDELVVHCPCILYDKTVDLSLFDLVHTHGIRPDRIGAKRRNQIKKLVVTIHNFVYDDLKYTYNKLVSLVFGRIWMYLWRRADLLITISHTMADYYRSMIPGKKIVGIHNGLSPALDVLDIPEADLATISTFIDPGKIVIGAVCAVTRLKGLDQLISLLGADQSYQLIVVGDGKELPNLMAQARKLKVDDRCLFLGYRNEGHRYFRFFNIFAVPSRSEGFGLTLLEAARVRVPIVCSDIPTFRELFSSEEVAFFENENQESLASSIKKLWDSKDEMTNAARKKFTTNYTDELMARGYWARYQELLDEIPKTESNEIH